MHKILRFTASWCQPCKVLEKNLIEANLDIPVEVIDIDKQPDVAKEYNVRSVPTLVLKSDVEESRLIGIQTTTKIKLWAMQ